MTEDIDDDLKPIFDNCASAIQSLNAAVCAGYINATEFNQRNEQLQDFMSSIARINKRLSAQNTRAPAVDVQKLAEETAMTDDISQLRAAVDAYNAKHGESVTLANVTDAELLSPLKGEENIRRVTIWWGKHVYGAYVKSDPEDPERLRSEMTRALERLRAQREAGCK